MLYYINIIIYYHGDHVFKRSHGVRKNLSPASVLEITDDHVTIWPRHFLFISEANVLRVAALFLPLKHSDP